MEIFYLNSVNSTQKYLKNKLKTEELSAPICIVANTQTDGIGSRGNSWISQDGDIFLSFAINKKDLPNDLPLASASIYFSYIFKQLLFELGSSLFIKWPNDFYIEDKKIGGTITELSGENLICGIGINRQPPSEDFGFLDIEVVNKELIIKFLKLIESYPSWQEIFSKFRIEFDKTKELNTHHKGKLISLKNAKLHADGSLTIDGRRVLNLR